MGLHMQSDGNAYQACVQQGNVKPKVNSPSSCLLNGLDRLCQLHNTNSHIRIVYNERSYKTYNKAKMAGRASMDGMN